MSTRLPEAFRAGAPEAIRLVHPLQSLTPPEPPRQTKVLTTHLTSLYGLYRGTTLRAPAKVSQCGCFVSGHDFSRAEEASFFVFPSGLQPARDLPFPLFRSLFSFAQRAQR